MNTWYTILSHSKYQCKFCPYSIHNKTGTYLVHLYILVLFISYRVRHTKIINKFKFKFELLRFVFYSVVTQYLEYHTELFFTFNLCECVNFTALNILINPIFVLDLKSHLLSEHKETLPFLCRDCGDSFITSNMLAYHRYLT